MTIFDDLSDAGAAEIETRLSCLSPREAEILRQMANGLTSEQIATDLQVKLRTIVAHRGRIIAKLGCHNIVQAVGELTLLDARRTRD